MKTMIIITALVAGGCTINIGQETAEPIDAPVITKAPDQISTSTAIGEFVAIGAAFYFAHIQTSGAEAVLAAMDTPEYVDLMVAYMEASYEEEYLVAMMEALVKLDSKVLTYMGMTAAYAAMWEYESGTANEGQAYDHTYAQLQTYWTEEHGASASVVRVCINSATSLGMDYEEACEFEQPVKEAGAS